MASVEYSILIAFRNERSKIPAFTEMENVIILTYSIASNKQVLTHCLLILCPSFSFSGETSLINGVSLTFNTRLNSSQSLTLTKMKFGSVVNHMATVYGRVQN